MNPDFEYISDDRTRRLGRLIWKGRLTQGLTPFQLALRAKVKRGVVLKVEKGFILPVRWILCGLVHKAIPPLEKREALKIVDELCPPRRKRFPNKQRGLRKQRCEVRKEIRRK